MKHARRLPLFIPCLFVLSMGGDALGQIPTNGNQFSATSFRNQLEADAGERIDVGTQPFYQDLYDGAKMTLRIWDIPMLAASFLLERHKPVQSVTLAPSEVDYEISEMVARTDGRKSLGALRPTLYPGLAATSRLVGMIALDATGIHDYSATSYARMFRFHQALYYTKVITHLAKRNIRRHRPDGSDTYAFFSGHTSTAFATSTFLYLEACDFIDAQAQPRGADGSTRSLPLLSPQGWKILSFGVFYGWAGYVGYSRIHDKKHYLTDVLVGAASGTLVSYLLYPHQEKNEKVRIELQPAPGGAAFGLAVRF
ncbi:phosphatase PAP2 family protein [candidate division KSB1 bacterium]|nr:phosphatase PAP2 family protein [candidate division KSB1 bacterium]